MTSLVEEKVKWRWVSKPYVLRVEMGITLKEFGEARRFKYKTQNNQGYGSNQVWSCLRRDGKKGAAMSKVPGRERGMIEESNSTTRGRGGKEG